MRLLRLSTAYPTFLEKFYAQRPGLRERPFAEQHAALLGEPYGWNNLWTLRFTPLGYEVLELVCNAEPMQRRWVSEHGLTCQTSDWVQRIAAAQVEAFRPDVVMSNDYGTFTQAFFDEVRARCASIRMVIGWCGGPYKSLEVFRGHDVMLTNLRRHQRAFEQAGLKTELMRHAFDPWWLEQVDRASARRIPFSFCGSVVKAPQFHNERERLLLRLLERTDIRLFADLPVLHEPVTRRRRWGYRAVRALQRVPGGRGVIAATPRVAHLAHEPAPPPDELEINPLLAKRASPSVFGRAMFQTLHDSELTLNSHIDIALDTASNMRLFEATGVGACLLTERQPDLDESFEPDVEVATYASPDEAAEKAAYLLENDNARLAMAAAGQKRTLRDHAFADRAAQIDALIRRTI